MTVAFIFGPNGRNENLAGTAEFYEQGSPVRAALDQAAEWTGFSVDTLLRRTDPPEGESAMRVNTISLAAGMLGMHDVLGGLGIGPSAVGGMSLGGMVSACVAGALTRRQLFDILLEADHGPSAADPDRRETIAFVSVPADRDPGRYWNLQDEGIFVAGDLGMTSSGKNRVLMLSGYRAALDRLAATDPDNEIAVSEVCEAAYHSPLRERARGRLEQQLRRMRFAQPAVPVCSCLDGRTLHDAGGVKDMLLDNTVQPLRVGAMIEELASHRPRLGLAVGPSLTRDLFSFPFPVVHVDSPDSVGDVVEAMFEFGVTLSTVQ